MNDNPNMDAAQLVILTHAMKSAAGYITFPMGQLQDAAQHLALAQLIKEDCLRLIDVNYVKLGPKKKDNGYVRVFRVTEDGVRRLAFLHGDKR